MKTRLAKNFSAAFLAQTVSAAVLVLMSGFAPFLVGAEASAASTAATPPVATPATTPSASNPVTELTKSSVDQLTKDFLVACEMSKLSVNLAKTPEFKKDAADLAYRVSELMSGALKTPEVKDTYRTIVSAAPESRVELWHRSAKELGVKNFKCKTIGFK